MIKVTAQKQLNTCNEHENMSSQTSEAKWKFLGVKLAEVQWELQNNFNWKCRIFLQHQQ